MSPGTRTESDLTKDLGLELALLCDALDMPVRGGFLFAVCEEGPLREQLVRQVRDHLQAEGDQAPIEVELSPDRPDLAGRLEQRLLYETLSEERAAAPAAVHDRPRPPAVFVHTRGLAEPRDEAALRALRAVNFQRERLSRLEVALLFWLSQNALGQVVQHAADLFAARSSIFYFEASLREPTAPPPMRAEAATQLLDRFHRTLLPPEELRKRAALYERRLEQQKAAEKPNWPRIASLCEDLVNIYRELDDYAQVGEYQDAAIAAYQKAIAAQESEGKGPEWASLQGRLGTAYHRRIRDDRAENFEQAIVQYQHTLEVYTQQGFPEQWATTQNNLCIAYIERISGDRGDNLEQAISYSQCALESYSRQDFPEQWAATQNNLGIAYAERIRGGRVENLEQAIDQYHSALEVYTHQDFPVDWAMTQNNLGIAYANRIRGERAENLERAIDHYQQALQVRTRRAFPIDWAKTQYNLGIVYAKRIHGNHAENLERAVKCFDNALSVWTAEAFPHYHEFAKSNLERALAESRPPSLRKRVQAALHRLRFWKSERLPKSHS
jgi:tetratricopeptide (TPR) repeat protein